MVFRIGWNYRRFEHGTGFSWIRVDPQKQCVGRKPAEVDHAVHNRLWGIGRIVLLFDVIVAVLLGVVLLLLRTGGGNGPLSVVVVAGLTASLALRRLSPGLALGIAWAAVKREYEKVGDDWVAKG